MKLAAIEKYPNEACGVIVNIGKKSQLFVCQNISDHPASQFLIDPLDYARAEEAGEISAIWHTHTDSPSTPSDADRAGCEASELPWLITSIYNTGNLENANFVVNEPNLLEPSNFEMDLLGRPYIFGIFDCYSLVVDYYKRNLGIEMPAFNHKRIPQFWQKGMDFFTESADEAEVHGFVEVTDESYKEFDLLVFTIKNEIPNHVAIYIGNDTILHHVRDRLSRREQYSTGWAKYKTRHFRHITKC